MIIAYFCKIVKQIEQILHIFCSFLHILSEYRAIKKIFRKKIEETKENLSKNYFSTTMIYDKITGSMPIYDLNAQAKGERYVFK